MLITLFLDRYYYIRFKVTRDQRRSAKDNYSYIQIMFIEYKNGTKYVFYSFGLK